MCRLGLLILLAAAPAFAEDLSARFDALDLNGDGYVSLAEAAGNADVVTKFDRADRNRDGRLSRKEFARLPKIKTHMAKARRDRMRAGVARDVRAAQREATAEAPRSAATGGTAKPVSP